MSRRRDSATALKASDVVAARAIRNTIYSHIGIRQAKLFPSEIWRNSLAIRANRPNCGAIACCRLILRRSGNRWPGSHRFAFFHKRLHPRNDAQPALIVTLGLCGRTGEAAVMQPNQGSIRGAVEV